MSRVELARINSLTFYNGEETTWRRTSALPQLVCVGKPCKLYQPEVVRCKNVGGHGTEVDWKCEADLPESLRFGRVEVSCEGYSGPGDPYVLKGSCSLNYRLVQVHDTLRTQNRESSFSIGAIIFSVLWFSVLAFVLYSLFSSCWRNASRSARPPGSGGSNQGGSSGWFPGGHDDHTGPHAGPPPPYSKDPQPSEPGWRPGFWTGAALGGIGTHLFNSNRRAEHYAPRSSSMWDWEYDRVRPTTSFFSGSRRTAAYSEDRGEGSSNLGSMRHSTGLGGSSVR